MAGNRKPLLMMHGTLTKGPKEEEWQGRVSYLYVITDDEDFDAPPVALKAKSPLTQADLDNGVPVLYQNKFNDRHTFKEVGENPRVVGASSAS